MRRLIAVVAMLLSATLLALPTTAQDATPVASPAADCPAATEEENEAVVMRWYAEIMNERNLDVIDGIMASDAEHNPPDINHTELRSPDETKLILGMVHDAFPDLQITVEELLSEGDLVVARWTATGTHEAEYQGYAPSGETETWTGINMFRFACGQIVRSWSEVDGLAQLGQGPEITVLPDVPASLATPVAGCVETTDEENAELARQWLDVWNHKDVGRYEAIVHPDTVHHFGQGADEEGVEDVQEAMAAVFVAFPDLEMTFHEVVADGNLVAIRFTNTATHSGQFFDLEPTGARITYTGITIFRIECGQVVESWSEVDGLGLREQLLAASDSATPAP